MGPFVEPSGPTMIQTILVTSVQSWGQEPVNQRLAVFLSNPLSLYQPWEVHYWLTTETNKTSLEPQQSTTTHTSMNDSDKLDLALSAHHQSLWKLRL